KAVMLARYSDLRSGKRAMSRLHLRIVILAFTLTALTGEALAVSVDIRVNASANDATQAGTTVNLTSTTMNLSNEDWVGQRFTNVTIPQGAYIVSAYVSYTASNQDAGNLLTTVYGEATDNSSAFTAGGSN